MECPECSAELTADAAFCPKCGARVSGTSDGGQSARDEPQRGKSSATTRERFAASVAQRQQEDDTPEEEVWEGTYSKLAMIGYWIAGIVLTVVVVVMSLATATPLPLILAALLWPVLVGWLFFRQWSVKYRLTSQRLLHEKGLLWRTTDRIELIDIDDVTFRQGPVERMLGVGTVHISSSDRTHPVIAMPGIENVRHISDMIDDLRRKERKRRGLHIEAV